MKLRDLFLKEFKIANQPDPKDREDYKAKMASLQDIQKDPKMADARTQAVIAKRKAELAKWAEKNLKTEDNMGFSDKEIKMAYGVLNNPKYKGGNMTGAVEVINKIAPGLADHPSVAKALQTTNEGEMRLDKSAFVQMLADKIKEPQKGHGRPEYDNRLLAKMYKLITGKDVDFEGNKFTITMNKPTTEDLDYKSEDILIKAGFDPNKVKEYMAVFNDHGDTSDVDQMNMDKIGLADTMGMVLASHGIKNESTNEDSVSEGAEMIAYHKHPTEKNLWTFPDAYKDDKEVESPYMSNASMRQFLSTLGYNPDFEDQSPVPAKEFIAVTTQWLQKNIDKKSPEEPTTIDKNPDGPTMISGGKPEGYMNRQVKLHNELARKIISKYPEVTHLGFN